MCSQPVGSGNNSIFPLLRVCATEHTDLLSFQRLPAPPTQELETRARSHKRRERNESLHSPSVSCRVQCKRLGGQPCLGRIRGEPLQHKQ